MERAVEIFVAINCLIIGLSHLLHGKVWVEFFRLLSGFGKAGAFANGFISITFGTIIVAFHWVWEGVIPTIITCFGIAQVLKSLIAFVMPGVVLLSMRSRKAERPTSYRMGGLFFLIFSAVIFYHLFG